MASRRHFLKLLGVSTAAAPLAAKAAADAEIANLTSLKNAATLATGSAVGGYGNAPMSISDEKQVSPYIQATEYLKLFGKLPEYVERDLRERAKGVSYLDPDIACKKSWSLNVKIITQQERNYCREMERFSNAGKYELAQNTFRKVFGFNWPW